MSTITGNLPATGGTIRRHRMGKDTPAHATVGESGMRSKVEGWALIIVGSTVAFAFGLLSPMIALLV